MQHKPPSKDNHGTNLAFSMLDEQIIFRRSSVIVLSRLITYDMIYEIKEVTAQLEQALNLLADRKSPDYRNSIKESISAVEAVCQLVTGSSKATLGEALRQLESKKGFFHPALRNAFNSLYGYTSDAEGIRHALLGESHLDVEDARFMLIVCSAFINYLVVKANKAGIQLLGK